MVEDGDIFTPKSSTYWSVLHRAYRFVLPGAFRGKNREEGRGRSRDEDMTLMKTMSRGMSGLYHIYMRVLDM